MRDLLIAVHAATGVIAFVLGVRLVAGGRDGPVPRGFAGYYACLVTMVATLLAAVVLDWRALEAPARLAFGGLSALALVVVARAERARRRLAAASARDRRRLVDDVGFSLVALFDGFAIVAAIDLGAPAWLVALVGVVGVVGGHLMLSPVARAAGPPGGCRPQAGPWPRLSPAPTSRRRRPRGPTAAGGWTRRRG